MKYVLVIGIENDPHIINVGKYLNQKGCQLLHIYVNRFPLEGDLSFHILPDGERLVNIKGHGAIKVDEIKAVYCRPYPNDIFNIKHPSPIVERFLQRECYALLKMIWECCGENECLWINPWGASEIAENKGLQMRLAAALGLNVPKTLITSSRDEAARFIKQSESGGNSVVLKTITGFRNQEKGERGGAFVTRISPENLGDLNYPLVLQEYVKKEYELRITIVGDKAFPCKITSQNSPNKATRIDWRVYDFKNVNFSPTTIPAEIEEKLIQLTLMLGLRYSAIDMIREPNGAFRFLELNPNGLWLWIEDLAGLPITDAIAELLFSSVI